MVVQNRVTPLGRRGFFYAGIKTLAPKSTVCEFVQVGNSGKFSTGALV